MNDFSQNQIQEKNVTKRVGIWVSLTLIVTVFFAFFSIVQIQRYEESIIEVYANSQDAYVQLVLDQINLVKDRTNEEIITEIISTLDSSSNRYWTFSSENALLFVKDVVETNRYKGFTTFTYYVTEEAKVFINRLTTNKVVHEIIPINERNYIVSGAAFEYNDASYQICLLTNPDTVLENNVYLNARINLGLAILGVLLLFLLSVISLFIINDNKNKALSLEKKKNEAQRIMIEKLTAALEREKLFDTRYSVFHHKVLPILIGKLKKRGISPITEIWLKYNSEEERQRFFYQSQLLLDETVFRFQNKEEKKIVLVAVKNDAESVLHIIRPFFGSGIYIIKSETIRMKSIDK